MWALLIVVVGILLIGLVFWIYSRGIGRFLEQLGPALRDGEQKLQEALAERRRAVEPLLAAINDRLKSSEPLALPKIAPNGDATIAELQAECEAQTRALGAAERSLKDNAALKKDAAITKLTARVDDATETLSFARRAYNERADIQNRIVNSFPSKLVARAKKAAPAARFEC